MPKPFQSPGRVVGSPIKPPDFTVITTPPIVTRPSEPVIVKPSPIVTSPALPVLRTSITPDLLQVRYFNPDMAGRIATLNFPATGVPRNQITVPISPAAEPTEKLLFEDAAVATKKFYLPCYRVATSGGSFRVTLQQSGEGGALTVDLEKYPAKEIESQARGAQPLEHAVAVFLQYRITANQGFLKELEFQEKQNQEGGMRAVLRVETLNEFRQLYLAMTSSEHAAKLVIRRVVKVAIPMEPASGSQEPLFRTVTRAFDNTEDFIFPPALFPNVTPGSGQKFGLDRKPVGFNGTSHNYYQDQAKPHVFYFLPDQFKIARRPQSPHHPMMSVQFTSPDGSVENMRVKLQYFAFPHVNPDRLSAAKDKLKPFITGSLPAGIDGPMFAPLLADSLKFRLALPGAQAAGAGPYQERKDAVVDLETGIFDGFELPLQDFQEVFDAMNSFGGFTTLLTGEVVAEIEQGQPEQILFSARLNDLVGELFDYQEQPDESSGGVKVGLKNAIESAIKINRLPLKLRRGEHEVDGNITNFGVHERLPVELKAGEELRLAVVPAATLAGSGEVHAVFDLDEVQVLPDAEAVLNAVIDPRVAAEFGREVHVKTLSGAFDPAIEAILVKFEGGRADVELNAEKREAKIKIPPAVSEIINLVLRKAEVSQVSQAEFRYRTRVICKDGNTAEDKDWRTEEWSPFYLTQLPM